MKDVIVLALSLVGFLLAIWVIAAPIGIGMCYLDDNCRLPSFIHR